MITVLRWCARKAEGATHGALPPVRVTERRDAEQRARHIVFAEVSADGVPREDEILPVGTGNVDGRLDDPARIDAVEKACRTGGLERDLGPGALLGAENRAAWGSQGG
jgi:hypothetical protein